MGLVFGDWVFFMIVGVFVVRSLRVMMLGMVISFELSRYFFLLLMVREYVDRSKVVVFMGGFLE